MAGLTTKTLKDGTGATFTGRYYDDDTGLGPACFVLVGGNVAAAGAGAVNANTLRTTLGSDDPAVVVLGATGGAAVVTDANGTLQQYLRGLIKLAITAGSFLVTASIAAGTNLIGKVNLAAAATGGSTPGRNVDVDESEDAISASPGTLYWIYAINTTNAMLWLKLYDDTVANVTVGSTTPVLTLGIPGNNDTDGAGSSSPIAVGLAFANACTVACTTGFADADTGAPATNAMVVSWGYKT